MKGEQLIYFKTIPGDTTGKKLLALVFSNQLMKSIGCQTILQNPVVKNVNKRICKTFFDEAGNYLIVFDDETKNTMTQELRSKLLQQLQPT